MCSPNPMDRFVIILKFYKTQNLLANVFAHQLQDAAARLALSNQRTLPVPLVLLPRVRPRQHPRLRRLLPANRMASFLPNFSVNPCPNTCRHHKQKEYSAGLQRYWLAFFFLQNAGVIFFLQYDSCGQTASQTKDECTSYQRSSRTYSKINRNGVSSNCKNCRLGTGDKLICG